MKKIDVNIKGSPYPILIERGARHQTGQLLAEHLAGMADVALVTNPTVGHHYQDDVVESIRQAGISCCVIEVPEKNMDAVTGLSGSGPAYVYLMIEALTAAGQKSGLPKKQAEKLALQTVFGAAKTMKETGKSAQELREMVTSPGGTTIEGLKVLEQRKFSEAVVEAVGAAAKKSALLARKH